ncbi:GNAT family N-acetyltransferase [Sphingobium bisphenolivorans]|uniref:GNAT family N-acetyltransferase n=1 Tax=Sphingobium bisphenolivorans TaxID=1335760 RepID=UPI0003AB287F|nr:GNAT family N-acetyltransferase [Sphingobium bisphenolivorans]
MTPILWRRAGPKDAAALSVLGGATFLASFAHDHPGEALIAHIRDAHGPAYYEAALADPACTILIGETPLRAPVAYAMLTPPDLPTETCADDIELKRIYLLGGWQGAGHGDALMQRVVDEAKAQGAARLLLAVYPQNDRAKRFYARHGFAEIGETLFMVAGVPFRDLIYASDL